MKVLSILNCLLVKSLTSIDWGKDQRIVAIGDLHGDYDQALKVLRLSKVVDKKAKWIGGDKTILIQTGDILGHGKDTKKLYSLFQRLASEATEKGGHVVNILGNHELMNLWEDYTYISEEEIETFDGLENRKIEFKEGEIGKYLRELPLVEQIGDTIFAHGGIHPMWAKVGMWFINSETKRTLQTYEDPLDLKNVTAFGAYGPAWFRGHGFDPEVQACKELKESLALLKAKRIVVGHALQDSGRITPRCDGRVLLIHVGISKKVKGKLAALEMTHNSAKALYPDDESEELPFPMDMVLESEVEEQDYFNRPNADEYDDLYYDEDDEGDEDSEDYEL
jgi:hypothetical protein